MPTLVTVPYVDLARQHAEIKDQLLAAAGRVIERGDFILGTETAEFERRFAELCGTSHAVGLNSGMDALVLSLKALDIGEGDEVITAPNSFVASAACIALVGARPVFVDVDESFNLDPDKVEAAITPRTKAILPIHLTGRPAAMEELVEIAQRFNRTGGAAMAAMVVGVDHGAGRDEIARHRQIAAGVLGHAVGDLHNKARPVTARPPIGGDARAILAAIDEGLFREFLIVLDHGHRRPPRNVSRSAQPHEMTGAASRPCGN